MILVDSDLRLAALAIAAAAHNGQTYDGRAFVYHLYDVAGVVEEFGYGSPSMIAAALLHDTVEDTDVTVDSLRELFPDDVVDIVWAVTDSTEGKNRRERKRNTYAKTAANRAAVCLKLCDRIANVRASVEAARTGTGKDFLPMYRKEHPDFVDALYRAGEYEELWAELNTLIEGFCPVCCSDGGPISVESGGVVTDHDTCPDCGS